MANCPELPQLPLLPERKRGVIIYMQSFCTHATKSKVSQSFISTAHELCCPELEGLTIREKEEAVAVFRLPPRRNILPCQKAEVLLTETLSHCTVVLIKLQTIHIFRRCVEYILKTGFIFRQNGRTVPMKLFLHVDLSSHFFT